jgi:acyclic terpene utilization AtuA family protein
MTTDLARGPRVKVVFPTGMLGGGFPPEMVQRGIDRGACAITIDGGSTDSGPFYLGTGVPKATPAAIESDLRAALVLGQRAGLPVIIGSCGTSGSDAAVDFIAEMTVRIAAEEGLEFRLAKIYSEQSPARLVELLQAGRISPLKPSGDLDEETISSCEHIVGLMGHEPILRALDAAASVVLAGRATDTSMVAAVALRAGIAPGPTWHAAKTVECGAQCTTDPRSGPVLVEIDSDGFTVESLDLDGECTPLSVAAHMLYENASPFRLREPAGTLDTTDATYSDAGAGRVRVEGSRFEPAEQVTIKLEGSARRGYQTISLAGIRDPEVVASVKEWSSELLAALASRVQRVLGPGSESYQAELRCYGADAILGSAEPEAATSHEVAAILKVCAPDQATATAIAKLANPLMLHMPLPAMSHLPSFAFMTSPAEIETGAIYEFVLNHVVAVDSETELFRTTYVEVQK